RIQAAFYVRVFGDGLDNDVGMANAVAAQVRDQPVGGRPCFTGILLFPDEQGLGASLGSGDALAVLILQRDREALERAPGGDVAAHDPGADYMYVPGSRQFAALFSESLQALLQTEYPQQIARCVRPDQLVDQLRSLQRVAVMPSPDVCHCPGSGIVL